MSSELDSPEPPRAVACLVLPEFELCLHCECSDAVLSLQSHREKSASMVLNLIVFLSVNCFLCLNLNCACVVLCCSDVVLGN